MGATHPLFFVRGMEEHGRITGVTGVLLAGGKSRRMGRDKRVLELEGTTLFARALSVLDGLFPEVLVAVAEALPEGVEVPHRVVTDLIPDCAALGGLYTGLALAAHPRVFVAACDMPLLSAPLIRAMVERDPRADVVMASLSHGLQPMHAVYSKRCLPRLEAMARERNLTLQAMAQQEGLVVRIVPEDELRALDPHGLSFLNINTPADLELARKLLASRSGRGA